MSPEEIKALAEQLRKPHGEFGLMVSEKMNEGNALINQNAIRHLELQPMDNVLEIGMGNGFFVKNILSVHDTICYSGCDVSELMIAESSKLNRHYIDNGQAEFILSTGPALPFESETFDKVLTVNTIYFWDDPESVLKEIRRSMKPGGKLIIAVRPKQIMKAFPITKFGFKLYGNDELVTMLEKSWFTVTGAFENEEPEQEFDGEFYKVSSYIICAEK